MAVNNNAAAVMLTLSALCRGGEVPVSRGELVEIGGKFRVPDVMAQSGAIMVDLGTTNKTHLSDYEDAINGNTAALLKVHTSNFRVVGFTESVSVAELVELGDKHGLPVIEDIGSGVLIDLSKYGLTYEPTVQESIRAGAAIVCFSGDKLLGGPQAGIIVGRKEYIKKIKKHPLTRAFRIDKFTAAALELTLQEYLSEENAIRNIPVLRMLTQPPMEIRERAEKLAAMLKNVNARVEVVDCESQVGGGSMPLERLQACGKAGYMPGAGGQGANGYAHGAAGRDRAYRGGGRRDTGGKIKYEEYNSRHSRTYRPRQDHPHKGAHRPQYRPLGGGAAQGHNHRPGLYLVRPAQRQQGGHNRRAGA